MLSDSVLGSVTGWVAVDEESKTKETNCRDIRHRGLFRPRSQGLEQRAEEEGNGKEEKGVKETTNAKCFCGSDEHAENTCSQEDQRPQ